MSDTKAAPAVNYMSMKSEDLKAIMEKYGMDKGDFTAENGSLNRQRISNMLKIIDVQVGKVKEVIVQDEKGNVATHEPTMKIGGTQLSGMMINIEFFNIDENDLPYVQLGLQGTALTIPREMPCWIPKEFLDGCLKHTVTTKLKMDVNRETGKIRYIPKQVPRFQYTVHDIKHIDVLKKEAMEAGRARQSN